MEPLLVSVRSPLLHLQLLTLSAQGAHVFFGFFIFILMLTS